MYMYIVQVHKTNKGVNMKFQHVTFKAANMRKAEQFTVYPHSQNDDYWKVQSEHRIAKIYKNGDMVLSKYVANYPSFVHLSDVLSPFKLKASDEIMAQLNSLQSTGKVVCVVGA